MNGDGGTGKSLCALQLAASTALGKRWLDLEVASGHALFISAEDDLPELHRRLASIVEHEAATLSDLDNLTLRSLAGEDALFAAPVGRTNVMQKTPLFRSLDQWLEQYRPTLTVLDTLADLFGGEENNRAQSRQFVGMLRGLAMRHETTILLLAHPSLSGMASGMGSSGSTAWNNAVRSRLYLRRVKSTDGDEPDPDARVLEVMKSNYAQAGVQLRIRWQGGVFVPDAREGGTLDRMAAADKADRVFLSLVRTYSEQGRNVSDAPGTNHAPLIFFKDPNSEGMGKKTLAAAMQRLFANRTIRIETSGPQSRPRRTIVVASTDEV